MREERAGLYGVTNSNNGWNVVAAKRVIKGSPGTERN